jgi:hypothetical protein
MARTTAATKQPAETLTGYFRRILKENPKLLNRRSNDELIGRWRADHPGRQVTSKVRAGLTNAKSALRHKQRQRKGRIQAEPTAPEAVTTHEPPRPAKPPHGLEKLEEQIDGCLSMARHMDREGLASVIGLLRRARNEVVWKLGQ